MCSIRVPSVRRFGSTRFGRVVVSLNCKLLFAQMLPKMIGDYLAVHVNSECLWP